MSKSAHSESVNYAQVDSELQFMKGKILTVIDSVITDEKQNKATKDLIHDIVSQTRNTFWRHCIGEEMFPKEGRNKF